ncbi:MAG: non-homologous end-joining DNA ligase [bacterium]|nr:non-homologous end-joining DNA ligase [bacterium]
MSAERTAVRVGRRTLALSNLDKVLYPRDGYTKRDVIAYYRTVAPYIVPHLRQRPLTLQRYPDGIDAGSFFEKHVPKGAPEWIERVTLASPEGAHARTTYLLCNDVAALAYLANLAALVLHVWTSRIERIDEPDVLFFDLDPGERCTIGTLARAALAMREVLASIALDALVKTSGGTGLHVVVPLAPGHGYDRAKLFAEAVAKRLAADDPKRMTIERSLSKRDPHAVYLDYLQVGRGKTMVAPYSLRARDGAPVSTPLDWSEVEAYARKRAGLPADVFAAHDLRRTTARLERDGDRWSGRAWKRQRLDHAI